MTKARVKCLDTVISAMPLMLLALFLVGDSEAAQAVDVNIPDSGMALLTFTHPWDEPNRYEPILFR